MALGLLIPDLGGSAVCRAAPPQAQMPGDAATPSPTGPLVHINVRGPGSVALYRLRDVAQPEASERTKVCDAPCDVVVDAPPQADFVLDGPRMTPSLSFPLAGFPSPTTIRVRPGFRGLSVAGWVTIGLGAAAVLAGGVVLTVADDDPTLRRAGGATLLSGLPLLVGGGVMAAFGATRFRFVDAQR